MSWQGWSEHYYNKGKEDFRDGVNNPPEDNLFFHPGVLESGETFTIADAQAAYDAGRSDAGREAAEDD